MATASVAPQLNSAGQQDKNSQGARFAYKHYKNHRSPVVPRLSMIHNVALRFVPDKIINSSETQIHVIDLERAIPYPHFSDNDACSCFRSTIKTDFLRVIIWLVHNGKVFTTI